MQKTESKISIIIPTQNGGELFRQTLESIFSQEIDIQFEVVVVDSGSTDQTLNICSQYPLKLIEVSPTSFHHSLTRNHAISESEGDICVLTVQDATPVDRRWLTRLVEPLLQNERIGGVFGQQISRDDASSYSRCCKLLWYREWRRNWDQEFELLPIRPDEWKTFSPEEKRSVARFDNVNSCIRRSIWQKIPFPQVPYAEDVAWAIDVLTSGFSIFWQPAAQVFHSHDRPLAYEFQRSYVDVKNLALLLGGSSSPMTPQMARSIIQWLAKEAARYLEATGVQQKKGSECEIISKADIVWQTQAQNEKLLKKKEISHSLSNGRSGTMSVKDILLSQYYGGVSGPKWFRKMCRDLFRQGRIFPRRVTASTSADSSMIIKLQASHRYFLNQLLQLHYNDPLKGCDCSRSIRFASAAAVAGSFLGQFLQAIGSPKHDLVVEAKSQPAQENEGALLWQVLADWYQQKSDLESVVLSRLDQLLTRGI